MVSLEIDKIEHIIFGFEFAKNWAKCTGMYIINPQTEQFKLHYNKHIF